MIEHFLGVDHAAAEADAAAALRVADLQAELLELEALDHALQVRIRDLQAERPRGDRGEVAKFRRIRRRMAARHGRVLRQLVQPEFQLEFRVPGQLTMLTGMEVI